MNIMELGALGEFVGSIGVIVTLIYLAIQIRQNTAQQKQTELYSRAAAVNASATALRDARRDIYQDSELSVIWSKGMSQPEELSEIEFLKYRLMIQNTVDGIWDIHARTTVTGVSPEIWQSLGVKAVERIVATTGGRRIWEQFKSAYPEEFRDEIDRVLATNA